MGQVHGAALRFHPDSSPPPALSSFVTLCVYIWRIKHSRGRDIGSLLVEEEEPMKKPIKERKEGDGERGRKREGGRQREEEGRKEAGRR